VRSFILPQGKGDTFPNYIIGQLSISEQATPKFKTGHYARNPAGTKNRNVPRNGNGKEFSVPSTFFFVISYVEVLNWCLALATYENAWG
jgi:hypothetical protein